MEVTRYHFVIESYNVLFLIMQKYHNILSELYPKAEINSVGQTKETGDIMLLRHLNYDHKLIFITSKNKTHTIDDKICNEYKTKYNWEIENVDVEFSGSNNKELFWGEDSFGPKQEALKNYNGIKIV